MVLEKILESPLYNKEIKPVNLKGSQPLTPAVLAEASTEGLKVERTDASTAEVPNHGSSKQIICSSTPGGSSERLLRNVNVYPGSPDTCFPSIGGQGRGILGLGGGGWLRDPLGPPLTK